MSWFKRSSRSKGGARRSKEVAKILDGNGDADRDRNKRLCSISSKNLEICDPDIFFQDPEHVRKYKEEAQFLQLMSEWEIIENPAASYVNFFSADFEDEFIQTTTDDSESVDSAIDDEENDLRTEIINFNNSNNNNNNNNNYSYEIECDMDTVLSESNVKKMKIYDLIFADHIQIGIALPRTTKSSSPSPNSLLTPTKLHRPSVVSKTKFSFEDLIISSSASDDDGETWCHENFVTITPSTTEKRFSINITCPREIVKNCTIDRKQLKTEALASSIMGAIGKCPDKDSSSTTLCSSENDLYTNTTKTTTTSTTMMIDRCHPDRWKQRCDHYDIKEFFHLDDYGNILLNINHIKEFKGHGFVAQSKRIYKRYRKECQCTEEDMFCPKRGCRFVMKRLFVLLWHITIGHPRNKITTYSNYAGPGDSVRAYTLQLAQDQTSTFARNIENFISCTKESREAAPQVVMRNMRQFMNGMKNYLVKHGEGKFQQEVDAARGRLKSDEFLNLDAILETVMHQLVVLPLREHLYGMFVDYYTRSEDIQLLAQNVKYACGRNASDFGIRSSVTPPSPTSLTVISNLLLRLQEAELPLDKLDLFLCVISTIFDATGCPRGQQLGADDFLPILVYVVAKCGFVGAEIEAEFMWGLLQPQLLNGEPGYYLTALCSAVHVLKSFMASENESGSGSLDWRSSSLPACSSVLRVIIPDECNGSLQTRTLPVRPHTTTREVCRIIAHKARITNPQDYALFKLVDGEETLLNDVECPQDIRLAAKGKHCMLAYKRIDAKIAWPTATQPMHN